MAPFWFMCQQGIIIQREVSTIEDPLESLRLIWVFAMGAI